MRLLAQKLVPIAFLFFLCLDYLAPPARGFKCETRFDHRNAIVDPDALWPESSIVFEMSDDFAPEEKATIRRGMTILSAVTCLKFKDKSTDDGDWVQIKKDAAGCWGRVGKIGGRQTLNLASGCVTEEVVLHQLLHTAGFFHEHSRIDRDQYIQFNFSNIGIADDDWSGFRIYPGKLFTPYDYQSILHMKATDLTALDPNYPTVIPIPDPSVVLGGTNLTKYDAMKVNALYNCNSLN